MYFSDTVLPEEQTKTKLNAYNLDNEKQQKDEAKNIETIYNKSESEQLRNQILKNK